MKYYLYMNKTIKILLISILFLLILDVSFRIYFYNFFKKHPLRYLEYLKSDIEGVPYLEINFTNFELNKTKPRIVILGDYISIHKSWENKTSYPELLDLKLNNSFEIINTAAGFYSLPEEVSLLKNKAIDYNPDIIIVGYVFNDLYLKNSYTISIPLKLSKRIYESKPIIPTVIKYYLVKLKVSDYFSSLKNNKAGVVKYFTDMHKDDKLVNILKTNLAELRNMQEDTGTKVIFLIVPIFYDFQDENVISANDIVYGECVKYNLICINMLEKFKNYTVIEVKEDDGDIWHQNHLGNEIIAKELYNRILGG